MAGSHAAGLFLIALAGVFQGGFMLPMKWTESARPGRPAWPWENTWLIFASFAYLLCPWTMVLATIPGAFAFYATVPAKTVATLLLFGLGWGLGAITFGLGVDAVGFALGFAVILGTAACAGTLVPLLETNAALAHGAVTVVSLAVMLAGVSVVSVAGKWKEQASTQKKKVSYGRGMLLCVISGLLSACGNIGFFYGRGVIKSALETGIPEHLATNLVWALLTISLFVCNVTFAGYLLWKNRSAKHFTAPGTAAHYASGALMGILWMAGFVVYGAGTRMAGELGPSLGWAVLMCVMVLTANVLGMMTGEWKGAPKLSVQQLGTGLALLLVAIVGLGYANR